MKSPLQRTMSSLKKEGYAVAVTEHWNSFTKTRQDLLGCMDCIAFRPDIMGVLGVNACAVSGISAHKKKYEENERLKLWLRAGNGFEIHGWYPWQDEERRDEVRVVQAYIETGSGKIAWSQEGDDDSGVGLGTEGGEEEGADAEICSPPCGAGEDEAARAGN